MLGLILYLQAVAVPSRSDQRKAVFTSAQDETRNVQQKSVLLTEVSIIWTKKCAALLHHSSELLEKSRELRKRPLQGAAKTAKKSA